MPLFLIRHPRPLLAEGVCYGQLDVASEDPLPHVARLRPCLPSGVPIFSSPLRRARLLAEALAEALGSSVSTDNRLQEISFGAWEGRAWQEIARPAIDAWAADVLNYTPPGGESVAALRPRSLDFAAALHLPDAVLVTHAGVMRALVGAWQQLPLETWTRLSFDYGELVVIEPPGMGAKP